MLVKNIKILLFSNFFLLIFVLLYLAYTDMTTPKMMVVDSQKLFDGFAMTKEMKRIGEKEFEAQKTVLDSIYNKMQTVAASESEKEVLLQQFLTGKEDLENFNQEYASQESLKIWSRIQTYTAEFSKEKKYSIIVASQSGRNILYADEKNDVTKELLQFLNRRYEGVK